MTAGLIFSKLTLRNHPGGLGVKSASVELIGGDQPASRPQRKSNMARTKQSDAAGGSPPPGPDDRFSPQYLLNLLMEIGALMSTVYDRRTRLSRNQTRLLTELLARDGQTQTELANALQIHKVSVGIYVNELEALHLIERRSHPTDRRAKCIYLTELMHSVKHRGMETYASIHRAATEGIGEDSYLTMLDCISLMRDNLVVLDAEDRAKGSPAASAESAQGAPDASP
jgi:DNA-binding MarR family transcriptional regulator